MYKTVIVEDDYMVAMLHRSFIEKDERFEVVAEFHSGRAALQYLLSNLVDLVVLDVYMPLQSGVELLRDLRGYGIDTEVIVVTAAHETQTLNELLKMGVMDYLVKPFTAERFQQALDGFAQREKMLHQKERVCQTEIDELLTNAKPKEKSTKGMQRKTFEKISQELSTQEGKSCEGISCKTGLSVVTVRRYLTYMLENGQAQSRINYDTGGRPSMIYLKLESKKVE